ncbi:acireductone synthase [Pokkaliibacter plantistimulans]|uniref:acireductone synthase n=1 Tax=Pokkaliibacter plantistimulans TaxID=1635171 RepID=UPI001A9C6BAF|nr:acireductone synthase [Pokkaliibacter plantistimulans]
MSQSDTPHLDPLALEDIGIAAVLTDIEGTTSDISFVKNVLFPYAAEHLPAFVREHADDPQVKHQLMLVAGEIGWVEADTETLIGVLLRWIEDDRKVTPLKTLQGMIWDVGYRQGDFTGHLYTDAHDYLQRWHQAGIELYVFSSGSVPAQKLLFGFSDFGDLTPLFSGYFDTTTGAKRERVAYQRIQAEIDLPAPCILFLSDIAEELDAARAAGMKTCELRRDGQPASGRHPVATDFTEVPCK